MSHYKFAEDLFRGPMPTDKLELEGFTKVICLQDQTVEAPYVWREKDWCEQLGIDFKHVPMSMITPPTEEQLHDAFWEIRAPQGKTLIHCAQGVDRTGLAVAYYRCFKDSWSFGRAIGEAIDFGFHLDRYCWWLPIVKERFP